MADFEKPSNTEEDYFAREEIEKKRRLALQQAEDLAAKQKEELRKLHYLKCPKCGLDLQTLKKGNVEIDTCFNCRGMWLDAGELEALERADREGPHRVTQAVLNIFRKR